MSTLFTELEIKRDNQLMSTLFTELEIKRDNQWMSALFTELEIKRDNQLCPLSLLNWKSRETISYVHSLY